MKKRYKITKLSNLSPMISLEWKKLTLQQQDEYNNIYYSQLEQLKKNEKEQKKKLG